MGVVIKFKFANDFIITKYYRRQFVKFINEKNKKLSIKHYQDNRF